RRERRVSDNNTCPPFLGASIVQNTHLRLFFFFFFFFQAEDGIRDGHVTGVQTCALPICSPHDLLDGGVVDVSHVQGVRSRRREGVILRGDGRSLAARRVDRRPPAGRGHP